MSTFSLIHIIVNKVRARVTEICNTQNEFLYPNGRNWFFEILVRASAHDGKSVESVGNGRYRGADGRHVDCIDVASEEFDCKAAENLKGSIVNHI